VPETQAEEYQLAQKEGRQPRCIYCGEPLSKIRQTQYCYLTWTWSEEHKRYLKSEDGDAEPAECANCEAGDWDFVDEKLVSY
jgi:hypothetical protein